MKKERTILASFLKLAGTLSANPVLHPKNKIKPKSIAKTRGRKFVPWNVLKTLPISADRTEKVTVQSAKLVQTKMSHGMK